MVFVGSSEVSGSWKIMAISLPRMCCRSSLGRPTSSLPASLIEPCTICPPGGSNPRMDSPVIDLPQPDSPTRPTVSPGSMRRSTFPTACTTDLVSWICVERSLISRTGAIRGYSSAQWVKASEAAHRLPGSALAQPHIERVAQCVADEVAGHHDQVDARAGRVDQPPGPGLQVSDPVREHVAPVDSGVMQPEAEEPEEPEGGHGQDRVGDVEGDVDD